MSTFKQFEHKRLHIPNPTNTDWSFLDLSRSFVPLPAQDHVVASYTPCCGYSFANIPLSSNIQRKAAVFPSSLQEGKQLQSRILAARSSGYPLDKQVRQRLEQRLGGMDLSSVRVHSDSEADRLSRSVNAVAFTTGPDIFFRSGMYNPSSSQGLHLLAHESTHVVQQAAGPVAGTPIAEGISVSDPGDQFERDAEASAKKVMGHADSLQMQHCPCTEKELVVRRPTQITVQRIGEGGVSTPSVPAAYSNTSLPVCPANLSPDSPVGYTVETKGNPEVQIKQLEFAHSLLQVGPPSSEKFHTMDRIEREVQWLKEDKPAQVLPEYPLLWGAYFKDLVNRIANLDINPFKNFYDPNLYPDIKVLQEKGKQTFEDGYYAYAYRVSDKRVAYAYTGKSQSINNPIPHSVLAAGGRVHASGVFEVKGGEIVSMNNASGHYMPDSEYVQVDDNCQIRISPDLPSLKAFSDKLDEMGYKNVRDNAFISPQINQEQQDCFKRPKELSMPDMGFRPN